MMTVSQTIYVLHWLIRDTFRQAVASRVFWIMLAASAVFIVFCLGVSTDEGSVKGPEDIEYHTKGIPLTNNRTDSPRGKMTLLFGAFEVEEFRGAKEQVHFLEVILASYIAGGGGLLLTLLWTAGFLPDFLQPGSASVLCAKPVPRWALLLGKYLGVVAFVAFQASVFFVGTWLALGLRTDQWLHAYLMGIPLLVLHFAVIYSFSVLVSVWTRSTIACLFASTVFWLVCWSMNFGHHYMATHVPELCSVLGDMGYWVLPKPLDIVLLFEETLGAGQHTGTLAQMVDLDRLQASSQFMPELSLLSSALFAAVMLGMASRELATTDY
jgi:ABC-type transport system involved in multi-copper enzyme maturation permease subunit